MDPIQNLTLQPPPGSEGACANNHPWYPETTRWRKRNRNGALSLERDCLRCKRASEARRRRRKRAEQRAAMSGGTS